MHMCVCMLCEASKGGSNDRNKALLPPARSESQFQRHGSMGRHLPRDSRSAAGVRVPHDLCAQPSQRATGDGDPAGAT